MFKKKCVVNISIRQCVEKKGIVLSYNYHFEKMLQLGKSYEIVKRKILTVEC